MPLWLPPPPVERYEPDEPLPHDEFEVERVALEPGRLVLVVLPIRRVVFEGVVVTVPRPRLRLVVLLLLTPVPADGCDAAEPGVTVPG